MRDLPQVVVNDAAHAMEHSLEVQLPFLQRMLGDFALAPFAVGMASVAEVAEVIERLWGGAETLIVLSTDMSHYHSYEQARAIDGATIERIASFATDIDHEEACGATPLNGLCRFQDKRISFLEAARPATPAIPRAARVAWSAIPRSGSTKAARCRSTRPASTLLALARGAIEHLAYQQARRRTRYSSVAQPAGATFVTLTKDDELRGCIGSLEPARALMRTWRRTRSPRRSATRASRP